jgi:uncharacterized protein YraI
MRKLILTLAATTICAAVGGAWAQSSSSPAATDKAGRAGPGTAAGEMGAAKPGATAPTGGTTSSTTGSGSRSSTMDQGSTSSSATATTGGDTPRASRSRRAARASKG